MRLIATGLMTAGLVAAWVLTGLALARLVLRLRDGVEVFALALPLGLIAHMLVGNTLGHLIPLPAVLFWTALGALVVGAWGLRAARLGPLEWSLSVRARVGVLALCVGLGLAAGALAAREYFGDDVGHASMAHLFADGQFPLRFQCNPAMPAAYGYGPNLLAAQAMVVSGLAPFAAVDLVKALAVTATAFLAFLTGWRVDRRVGAGLLAVLLVFTVGQMVWVYAPIFGGWLGAWIVAHAPALEPMTTAAEQLMQNPWRYTIVTPGYVTTAYPHAHRSVTWGMAPVAALVFLALLEAPLGRRRRTVALALVFGAVAVLQPAVFLLLGFGLAAHWVLSFRSRFSQAVDASLPAVLLVGGAMAAFLGGPLTDSVSDWIAGVSNPSGSFVWSPLQLPSCRGRAIDLRCILLSAGNIGLTPFLLPWAAVVWWRSSAARTLLLLGCAGSYAVPFFFRYGYIDWNIQRMLTYASWTLAALLAVPLERLLRAGGPRRLLALALLGLGCWGGLAQLGVVADGRWLKDANTLDFWQLGPLDDELGRQVGDTLPKSALVFDPAGCLNGYGCRPAVVLGRYSATTSMRITWAEPTGIYAQIKAAPRPEVLRQVGLTHVYVDERWLRALGAQAFSSGYELLAVARDATGLRALLRVCAVNEGCAIPPDRLAWP